MGIAARVLGLVGFILILLDGSTAARQPLQQLPPESPTLQETKPSDEPKPELKRPTVWGEPTEVRIHLYIHVVGAGLVQEEVRMVDDKSGIASQFSIPDFEVTGWQVEPAPYPDLEDPDAVPGFIMEIEIKRRFGFFVMKTIIPLCLIVMMSWAPR